MRHIDRIQKYLDGKLSDDELKKFKDDLQKDPELVQELDLHRSLDDIILSKDEERFRKKLDEAYKLYKIKSNNSENVLPERKKFSWSMYYSASLAAVFLLAVLIFIQLSGKKSNESVFNKYLSSYSADLTSRSMLSAEKKPGILGSAKDLYTQNNYSEASRLFSQVLYEDSENTEALFYNGLCLIYLNEFERAITSFDKVLNQPFNYFQEYAKWYLALCYIKTNQNETARILLKEIVTDNEFFSPKAKKILRKLR